MKLRHKEKKKKEPVSIEKEQAEDKVSVIKTDKWIKIGRIILWTVILFLLLRGIASILAPGSEQKLEQVVTDYQADAKLRESAQVEAAAFAEDFTYEYYTFSGKFNSDYEQRVKRYLAKNLDIKSPTSGQIQAKVNEVSTTKISYVSSAEMDVDVHLVVTYMPLSEGGEQTQKDIYLRVPVSRNKSGGYAVTSTPLYISQVQAAGNLKVEESYTGEQIATKDVQHIKDTLNSFFAAYYRGTETELSYYLIGNSNIKAGVGGSVAFSKLDYITAFTDMETGDILVDATVTVLDNMQPMQQRLFMRLQYAKGRYYIKSINTRPI